MERWASPEELAKVQATLARWPTGPAILDNDIGTLGSPIFPSGCEGKLGVALESLQGRRDLT